MERIGGVGLQIIRDWVLRFNARGPDGLVDGITGAPSKLNADHRPHGGLLRPAIQTWRGSDEFARPTRARVDRLRQDLGAAAPLLFPAELAKIRASRKASR